MPLKTTGKVLIIDNRIKNSLYELWDKEYPSERNNEESNGVSLNDVIIVNLVNALFEEEETCIEKIDKDTICISMSQGPCTELLVIKTDEGFTIEEQNYFA